MSVETVAIALDIDPCPFCGSKDPEAIHSSTFDLDEADCVWVECERCFARGPVSRVGCRDDEFEGLSEPQVHGRLEGEAITMWNSRIRTKGTR